MTQLCWLGNSHLAAIRDAYGAMPEAAREGVTFLGAHQELLLETRIDAGVLRPDSPAARDAFARLKMPHAIDLNAQDVLVIAGAGYAVSRAATLYRTARFFDLPSMRTAGAVTPPRQLVSEPAFAEMLQDGLARSLAGRLARHLRRGTDVPILIACQPRTTTAIRGREGHSLSVLNEVIAAGDGAALSRLFDDQAGLVAEALEVGYLPQPRETIEDDVLTARPFTEGAIRLATTGRIRQAEDDLLHANSDYGAKVIAQVGDWLSGRIV